MQGSLGQGQGRGRRLGACVTLRHTVGIVGEHVGEDMECITLSVPDQTSEALLKCGCVNDVSARGREKVVGCELSEPESVEGTQECTCELVTRPT